MKKLEFVFSIVLFLLTSSFVMFLSACGDEDRVNPQDNGKKDAGLDDEVCKDPFGCDDTGVADDDDNDNDDVTIECDAPKVASGPSCVCPADMFTDRDGNCVTCEEGQEWNERRQQCMDHKCESDFECCPAQACNAGGQCVTRFTACSGDEACAEKIKNQACLSGYCNYKSCNTDADCDPGLNCFNKYCVSKAPCKGVCKAGEVCVTPFDKCMAIPELADETNTWYKYKEASQIEGCDQTCDAGYLLVFADPVVTFADTCASAACSCEAIPPVPFGDTSIYSSIGILNGAVIASAYNQTYGDLMFVNFDANGVALKNEAVILDGVPADGEIVGDP
ncbi:MAG: hypothetical protein PHQ00_06720, partial [Phycisphaerae bacterium]|nr:hypothetical protein [Phycisphaerae bacterium]